LHRLIRLFVSLVLPFIAGGIGSYVTAPAIPIWYDSLVKPAISPPNWIFAPVWTLLYLLMGAALYRLWPQGRLRLLFLIHLVLNAL